MIDGNLTAELQIKVTEKNEIGERVATWKTVDTLKGWLDLASGDSKRTPFLAKIQESTHIFLSDFKELTQTPQRMIIKGKVYDVLLVDNPMELDEQLEIYLKYIGGQDGGRI